MIAEGESFGKDLRLRDISGIGSILEKRILTCFGSEEKALETLLKGDIQELCRVEGMTRKSAQSLILNLSKEQNGVSLEDFLKTKEAETLYANILKLIQKHCCTEYSSNFIGRLIPYPLRKAESVFQIRENIEAHLAILQSFSSDENEMIRSLLSQISPVKEGASVKIRDRAILTFSENTYLKAHQKFGSYLPVHNVSDQQECADYFMSYNSAVLFDFPDFDLPESGYEYFREIDSVDIEHIIPEIALSFFVKNLKSLDAALRLAEILAAGSADESFSVFSLKEAFDLRMLLKRINADGCLNEGADEESDRLKMISSTCDEILLKKANELSEKLKNALIGNTFTLDSNQIMNILSGADLKEVVTANLSKPYRELLKETLSEIASSLSLKRDEEMLLSDIYGEDISCPVKMNLDSLTRFKKDISTKLSESEQKQKKKLSKELAGYKDAVCRLIEQCLDFDCWYSVAGFADFYQMSFPVFAKSAQSSQSVPSVSSAPSASMEPDFEDSKKESVFFDMKNGRNLFLSSKYDLESVVPVSYDVKNAVLLSGVNSGGKTTLLELVGQCLILAHMGFPVPAEHFEFSPIEEFYYFGKSKGTLDAGAFETTLKNFSIVSKSNGTRRAVFADELESITEPGASAKIIGGLLETFCENGGTLSLFVSHLAESILENCDISLRVDGIDADGLDENLNLIINRNPVKNHIAKSTPELIVEKLFLTSTGEESEFYGRLKAKFEGKN